MRTSSRQPTMGQLWRSAVDEPGDHTFLIFRAHDGETTAWTYRSFGSLVDHTAGKLHRILSAPADGERPPRVFVALKNSPAFVAVWLACAELGVGFTAVDPRLVSCREAEELALSSAVDERDIIILGQTPERRSSSAQLLTVSEDLPGVLAGSEILADKPLSKLKFPAVIPQVEFSGEWGLGEESDSAPPQEAADGMSLMAPPVSFTNGQYADTAHRLAQKKQSSPHSRWFASEPLWRSSAMLECFGPAVAAGDSVVLSSEFDPASLAADITAVGADHLFITADGARWAIGFAGAQAASALQAVRVIGRLSDGEKLTLAQSLGCSSTGIECLDLEPGD